MHRSFKALSHRQAVSYDKQNLTSPQDSVVVSDRNSADVILIGHKHHCLTVKSNLSAPIANYNYVSSPCPTTVVPAGSPRGGAVVVYVFIHSFLFCSCVYFCFYGPFNFIPFRKFSRQISAFRLCSSGLNSALSVLSTIYLFVKVSLSPEKILCG